jgi:hypothetical protein
MSYPPRSWNEAFESDPERRRDRRRNEERSDRDRDRGRYESQQRGRRREDDDDAFDAPSGFSDRERWDLYEEWQQPRRMGGYYESQRFGSQGGFPTDQGSRSFQQRERGNQPQQQQDWQQGRRYGSGYGYGGGGYGEQNYSRENQRFGEWESQRRGEPFRGGEERSRFGGFGEQQRGFSGRGPKNYKRSDQRIQEDICDRLTSDFEVDASEIQVEVKNGEVTLEGSVPERTMKRRAEDCIEDVNGVSQVHNRLRVASQQQQSHGQGTQGSESWARAGSEQRADQPGSSQSRSGRTT